MNIQDGTGKGFEAKVNARNRLSVEAVTQTTEHFSNLTNGTAWNNVVQQTPTGANDCIFYFKNTGTKTYILEGFHTRVASAQSLLVYLGDTGTPSGGTANTPRNLNTGSSKVPTATIQAGNDITGLSGGNLVYRIFLTNTASANFNFEQDLILEPGGVFTVYCGTGSVQTDFTLAFHESEPK